MSSAEQFQGRPLDARYTIRIQQQAQQMTFTIINQHSGEEIQFGSLLRAFEYLEQQFRPSLPGSLR